MHEKWCSGLATSAEERLADRVAETGKRTLPPTQLPFAATLRALRCAVLGVRTEVAVLLRLLGVQAGVHQNPIFRPELTSTVEFDSPGNFAQRTSARFTENLPLPVGS
jgi:hypothetical protein